MIQEFWQIAAQMGLAYHLQIQERCYDQEAKIVSVLFENGLQLSAHEDALPAVLESLKQQ